MFQFSVYSSSLCQKNCQPEFKSPERMIATDKIWKKIPKKMAPLVKVVHKADRAWTEVKQIQTEPERSSSS